MPDQLRAELNGCAAQVIVKKSKRNVIDLNDLEQYTVEQMVGSEDRTLRTFLELLVSQYAIWYAVRLGLADKA